MPILFLALFIGFFATGLSAEPIRVPSSEGVMELLIDLKGVMERKGDVVALMNLYSFEKRFEEWEESDFSLFQSTVLKYIREGSIDQGITYPEGVVRDFPSLLAGLKEAQKRYSGEREDQQFLKELQNKIYTLEREIKSGKAERSSFDAIEEVKSRVQAMELYSGGEADHFRDSILIQIAALQEKKVGITEGEKKSNHQQEIDRLNALQLEKQEHRRELLRWGLFAIIAFLIFAFWWSRQQSVGESNSQ